ncbi:Deacetylase sirtuin-type domain-containing protein [Mycena chlorophos]|uniref:Deacetylase sirtuin-type domain-containing protein n=1 Tax=Mycena chlorophos TaxID=658473 RepID=A0A8H6W9X5_MYCCL|nr:Deacetylase sirtuin-type domain-containing protein [Mycena chlorophos]
MSSTFELTDEELAAAQIRAFLAAAEEVDMDPGTAEELIQTLILKTTEGSELHLEQDGDGLNLQVDDLDLALLYSPVDPELQTWSHQQIRAMLHHLKERGAQSFIEEYCSKRNIPVPQLLLAFQIDLSPALQSMSAPTLGYFLRVAMNRELQLRDKLPDYNTVEDAVRLIRDSRRILILTGAGISVSCGIPDFRSQDGIYASLRQNGQYDLDDPQQMFDISYFRENPAGTQIYPSNFTPSPSHRFIKLVENKGQLLRNYTQNIDTLETLAGVTQVLQCHGSFATASCLSCRRQVTGTEIEAEILAQVVPLCSVCNVPQPESKPKKKRKGKAEWESDDDDEADGPAYPPWIMKPNITFFGEKLSDHFDQSLAADRNEVDLLLVIGTSLKVAPVADILAHLPHSVPQILINKTPIRHINPDIILLGNADDIIMHLCLKLDWDIPPPKDQPPNFPRKRSTAELHAHEEPRRVGDSHIWTFEGAEGGEWLRKIEEKIASAGSNNLACGSRNREASVLISLLRLDLSAPAFIATTLPAELVDMIIQLFLHSPRNTTLTSSALFSLITPLSLTSTLFRKLALQHFFRRIVLLETDARKANREWTRLFRLLVSLANNYTRDCYNWVRCLTTTSNALIGPYQLANLAIFPQLQELALDFASDGLATQKFTLQLLDEAPRMLTVLRLSSLPSITLPLLRSVASRFPFLARLHLSATERLEYHCWDCYEESLGCTIHSPIPGVFSDVEHMANVFATILRPLKFLTHLRLGIYLSDEILIHNHIRHAEAPEVLTFGPEECLLCNQAAEHVRLRELVAALEFAQHLKGLRTIGFSSFFDRTTADETTTVYILRADGRLRVRQRPWDKDNA